MPSNYKIITSKKELLHLIEACKDTKNASVDFETNGEPFYNPTSYPTILGVSYQPGSSIIIPLGHKDSEFKDNYQSSLIHFGKQVIENPEINKVAWNTQFEYCWFSKYGITMRGLVDDAMLAKYILDEDRPMGLKEQVSRYLPEFAGYDLKGQPSPKAGVDRISQFWSNVDLNELSKYCGLDCDNTLRLMIFYYDKLRKNDLYKLYRNMLTMGVRVLSESKMRGIEVNKPYLKDLDITYVKKLDRLDKKMRALPKINKFEKILVNQRIEKEVSKIEQEIIDLRDGIKLVHKDDREKETNRVSKLVATREKNIDKLYAREFTTNKHLKLLEPINFNSPPQLRELFFTKEGFKLKSLESTDTGEPSTAEEVLLKLQEKDKSGFIKKLLKFRGLVKLHSTYIVGILNKLSTDNKIHADFLLHGTVTGRLSSRNPNMQNIPRGTTASDIKPMFIVPEGYLLLQLDYSQAELRVMAAQAGETNMIKWFKDGRDIHLATACDMNSWDYNERLLYLKDENHKKHTQTVVGRKYAKTINFGIIYGQGDDKLSEGMGVSKVEATEYKKEYFRRFPKIKEFINKQKIKAHKQGYVTNVFGRRRRLWNALNSPNKWEVAEAERQSVNAPIQGAASDYTLFSSILIWEQCRYGKIPYMPQVYTVHDSLGYYVKPENLHKIIPILTSICNNPETMEWFGFQIDDVTMQVDFEVSEKNWFELRNYNKDTDYIGLVKKEEQNRKK